MPLIPCWSWWFFFARIDLQQLQKFFFGAISFNIARSYAKVTMWNLLLLLLWVRIFWQFDINFLLSFSTSPNEKQRTSWRFLPRQSSTYTNKESFIEISSQATSCSPTLRDALKHWGSWISDLPSKCGPKTVCSWHRATHKISLHQKFWNVKVTMLQSTFGLLECWCTPCYVVKLHSHQVPTTPHRKSSRTSVTAPSTWAVLRGRMLRTSRKTC